MRRIRRDLWWGTPNRFSDRENERKVSWLELFYDLIYVAAIANLTHHLSEHLNWSILGFSLFIFSFIYWSWSNGSLYHDLHGNNAIRTRWFTLLQIMALGGISVTMHDLFNDIHQPFAITLAIMQLLITYLWWSTGNFDPTHKKLNRYYVFNYSISFILIAVSIFVTYPVAMVFWAIALFLNYSASLISSNIISAELNRRGDIFLLSESMVERYGLLTIIVLGETVFGITDAVGENHNNGIIPWLELVVGILIAFLLWWIYFGLIGNKKVKEGFKYFVLIDYLNLVLLFAIGVIGACLREMVSSEHFAGNGRGILIFSSALVITLFTIIALTYVREYTAAEKSYVLPTRKCSFIAAILLLMVPLFTSTISALGLISIVSLILLFPVLGGIFGAIRHTIRTNTNSP